MELTYKANQVRSILVLQKRLFVAPNGNNTRGNNRSHMTRDLPKFGNKPKSKDLVLDQEPKKRVSKRAIEKQQELEKNKEKLKRQLAKPQKIKNKEPAILSKKPSDLWEKKPKYQVPEIPENQKNNFRYRQSPVMRVRDLALGGKAEEAFKIFKNEICVHHKDRIDEFTYNQLLLACARSSKWNLSFRIYNDMKKRAVKPTIKTISNMFNCLATVSYPTKEEKIKYTKEKIQYLISEMEKNQIEPNTQSYNILLKVLGSIQDFQSSLKLISEMNANSKISTDITTYTQLVEIFGKDNLVAVFSIWDDLKERDIQPTNQFYNSLMKYCNLHRKPEISIEISLQMLNENLIWDAHTISILCTTYGLLGECSYAGVLLKKVDVCIHFYFKLKCKETYLFYFFNRIILFKWI